MERKLTGVEIMAQLRRSKTWLQTAAIWLCIGVVQATQTHFSMRYAGMHHAWARLFGTQILNWLPWALATPLVVYLGRRWLAHCIAVALIAILWAGLHTTLESWLRPWAPDGQPGPFFQTWLYSCSASALVTLAIYALILIVSFLIDSHQKLLHQAAETARLNEQLSQAQLNALRRQIEPHFIFNSLNCIAGMVREEQNTGAVNMIVALSDVLRRLTRESTESQVSLQREVEFLEKYCEIQKLRFAERLNVVVQVPEELRGAQVPSLILQPLVENAVKHGIAQRAEGGRVQVAARREHDRLKLTVYNDGPPLRENWASGGGVGLSNLKNRLALLFGSEACLSVSSSGVDGVEVLVTMPFRESDVALP